MEEKRHVVIQKRINEAIEEEIEKFFKLTKNDPLLNIIITGDIENLSLNEVKKKLSGE